MGSWPWAAPLSLSPINYCALRAALSSTSNGTRRGRGEAELCPCSLGWQGKRESFLCQGARDCSSGAAAHLKATFWGFLICTLNVNFTWQQPHSDHNRINAGSIPNSFCWEGGRGKSVGSDFCAAGIISVPISLGWLAA